MSRIKFYNIIDCKRRKELFRWFYKMPISNKITVLYATVFLVIFFTHSAFYYINASYFYYDISRRELIEVSEKVTNHILAGGDITEETINTFRPNEYVIIDVSIIDDRLEDFDGNDAGDNFRLNQPNRQQLRARHFDMYRPNIITHNDQTYAIVVTRLHGMAGDALRFLMSVFVVVNIVGIFIALLMGRFISRKLLAPITNITNMAEKISVEDLSQRISEDGPDDEIKRLTVTFNDMIERLEQSFKKQNQFMSDASHELRTPVSVIKGYANLMDRWGKDDPEILQESIDSIKSETEHMTHLIKKLLFLAKEEQNQKLMQKGELVLNFVAGEVIKEFVIMDVKVNIEFIEKDEVVIFADFDFIKLMLRNFVENSVKYTIDPNKKITVTVFKLEDKGYISIKDQGIGINQEDIPYIFERFFRGDKSRSKEIVGAGLGLSIAHWIIEQHHAKAHVTSELGKGTEIVVEFDLM